MILQRLPDEGGHSTVLLGFSVESISFPLSEKTRVLLSAQRNIMEILAFLVFKKHHDLSLRFDAQKKKEGGFVNLCTYGVLEKEEFLNCFPRHVAFFVEPSLTEKVNLIFLAYDRVDRKEIPKGRFPMNVEVRLPSSRNKKTGKQKLKLVRVKFFLECVPTAEAKQKP